jgi:hypothetical protein
MADPINLRRARKAKVRIAHDNQAAQNRLSFGRSKAEKSQSEAKNKQTSQQLDGLRLIKDSPDAPD